MQCSDQPGECHGLHFASVINPTDAPQ